MYTTMKLKLTLGALLFYGVFDLFAADFRRRTTRRRYPPTLSGVVRLDAARIVELSGADPSALLKGYIENR